MTTRIKCCGINDPAAVDAALRLNVDYIGFVFFAKSPRHLSFGAAAQLAARSGDHVERIGLFVDADDAMIGEAVAAARLDGIQLHGSESVARVADVRARFALPVWKALGVRNVEDIAAAAAYAPVADRILFDAKPPRGADLPGGLGVRFDWDLLRGYKGPPHWGLAGGLSPDNVAEAMAATGAPLVDVSSGIESAPGVKDVDKMAAFCNAVRHYDPH